MIDEYTGKKIVSPLDFTTSEKAVIDMLAAQGKTVQESADFLAGLANKIKAPAYAECSRAINLPLSDVVDSIVL